LTVSARVRPAPRGVQLFQHWFWLTRLPGAKAAGADWENLVNGKLRQALGWSIRPQSPAHDRLVRNQPGASRTVEHRDGNCRPR